MLESPAFHGRPVGDPDWRVATKEGTSRCAEPPFHDLFFFCSPHSSALPWTPCHDAKSGKPSLQISSLVRQNGWPTIALDDGTAK
ncbi:hypothetical protein Acid345_0327 [Candidatus Koribacter versatilis Ellin345]|uniref:Uncharacterized protein n=1 Tax=Koribacter versatilis (strain Ellin345) TaxID=204669 RepID=Q1IUW8_KORVE|nr:hypothetical protein Acid345_0327 [Candidatus Koribacter versatilis Ellin345]